MFDFPAIIDIGSASFKYDMRRLTEILAFPKAWYRRSIVRRMFLGDLSMSGPSTEDDDMSSAQHSSPGLSRSHERCDYIPSILFFTLNYISL